MLSAVSAADDATSDIVSLDEDLDVYADGILANNPDTFTNLNTTINGNNNSEINLNLDYAYTDGDSSFKDGIEITRDLTINGNGHIIDGKNQSRIFKISGCNVILKDIYFVNGNCDSMGGAISTNGGNVTISHCYFVNNSATRGGGAVYFKNCIADISNCFFIGNSANGSVSNYGGGAIISMYSELTFSNSDFENNICIDGGGGVADLIQETNATFSNCNFVKNKAGYNGGVLHFYYLAKIYSGKNCIISNCNFKDNCGRSGGAISFNCISFARVLNTNFVNNFAILGGGAAFGGSNFSVEDIQFLYCNFVNNTSNRTDFGGGALGYCYSLFCNFTGNHAEANAGAIYMGYVSKCIFKDNTAKLEGNDTYNTTIIKLDTQLSSSAVTTVFNGGKYLTITLKDSYGNPISGVKVSVVLNGKAFTPTTDKNGQAKVSTDGFAPKAYDAAITFAENVDYLKSTKSVKVTVKKATPKLTAAKKTFKAKAKTKKYAITLKTNQNKAMKSTKVYLKVKKITYVAKTNSKGKATFKITKLTKKGKFSATITYKGDKNYNKVTKKATITVK